MQFLHIEEYIEYCQLNGIKKQKWAIQWAQMMIETDVICIEVSVK